MTVIGTLVHNCCCPEDPLFRIVMRGLPLKIHSYMSPKYLRKHVCTCVYERGPKVDKAVYRAARHLTWAMKCM